MVSNSEIEHRVPTFSDASITNAASLVPRSGLAPGGLVTIFGTNLTNVSGIVTASEFFSPLPTELNGTRVEFIGLNGDGGGGPGRILAIANIQGQEQITLQVPNGLLGLGCLVSAPDGCDIRVVVTNNGVASAPVVMNSPIASPGIFTVDGTTGAITHTNTNQPVTASAPAARGEVVSIYATGLGPIFHNTLLDGVPAPADPPIDGPVPAVTIDGQGANVLRSILAPGLVGVNRLDVEVPGGASSGSVDIYIGAMGFSCIPQFSGCDQWTSNAVKTWIQ
jgi:uncharacterized protein (TIGR03437 family)